MNNLETIKEIIKQRHLNDVEQQDFIFSQEKRILVEAAAGYGKTRSMISKIAYLIASKQIPNPKKILALTFSVNAAYKIKKDVAEQLPNILQSGNQKQVNVSDRIYVSNYHGFCRRVLRLYGYLLHENLRNIDTLKPIDDSQIKSLTNLGLSYNDAKKLSDFNDNVKSANREYIKNSIESYNQQVIRDLLVKNYIPYNAILTLTIKLFCDYPNLLSFYQSYFPIIIVDEFQDTNILSFKLLYTLISAHTKVYLVGDNLQRIYGFIGAIPNLMNQVVTTYSMQRIELKQNYRFKENEKMLLLDRNVRENARNLSSPDIQENVKINFQYLENQQKEAEWVLGKVQDIHEIDSNARVVILFRNGYTNQNTKKVLEVFDNNNQSYFFALFSDEDEVYRDFHKNCGTKFSETLKTSKFSKSMLKNLLNDIHNFYQQESTPLYRALLKLLEKFFDRLYSDYKMLSEEDKTSFVIDTFEHFALKQSVEYVEEKVIFSTIHGAKGLEWDYVVMPDCEQYSIPNWLGLCSECNHKSDCNINLKNYETKFLEELSVFYVGLTRAKKEVYFSASRIGIDSKSREQNRNVSCMLKLKGIEL